MRRFAIFLFLTLIGIAPARAQPLVADLSQHLIAITTGFSGTEVLLFGATEGEGDVVVIIRGPDAQQTVRRKARVAGIWVNRDSMTFTGVPSFYRIAASRALDEIATPAVRVRHQLGLDHLRVAAVGTPPPVEVAAFRAGLLRNQQRDAVYQAEVGQVTFLGQRLFRARIALPANVPTGAFTVEVLLLQNGEVVAAQTTPMIVSKIGLGAEIFDFAHRYAAVYGLLAVLIAVAAGWAAGAIFRKG